VEVATLFPRGQRSQVDAGITLPIFFPSGPITSKSSQLPA